MPPISHLMDESERIHYLLYTLDAWTEEVEGIQKMLPKLSMDTKIDNSQLFKKVNNNWFLFPKPLEHLEIMCNAHRVTGHAGNKKSFEKI